MERATVVEMVGGGVGGCSFGPANLVVLLALVLPPICSLGCRRLLRRLHVLSETTNGGRERERTKENNKRERETVCV